MNTRKKTAALCAVLLCATAVCGWFEWRALTTPAYVYEAKEYLKEAAAAEAARREVEMAGLLTHRR